MGNYSAQTLWAMAQSTESVYLLKDIKSAARSRALMNEPDSEGLVHFIEDKIALLVQKEKDDIEDLAQYYRHQANREKNLEKTFFDNNDQESKRRIKNILKLFTDDI